MCFGFLQMELPQNTNSVPVQTMGRNVRQEEETAPGRDLTDPEGLSHRSHGPWTGGLDLGTTQVIVREKRQVHWKLHSIIHVSYFLTDYCWACLSDRQITNGEIIVLVAKRKRCNIYYNIFCDEEPFSPIKVRKVINCSHMAMRSTKVCHLTGWGSRQIKAAVHFRF